MSISLPVLVKNFIVGYIVKMTRDEAQMVKDKAFVNKMNLILVQVSVTFHKKTGMVLLLTRCGLPL
jgi:paraquat-inducible protein B